MYERYMLVNNKTDIDFSFPCIFSTDPCVSSYDINDSNIF